MADLARLARFLMNGKASVLPQARIDEMTAKHADAHFHLDKTWYGYGLYRNHTLLRNYADTYFDTAEDVLEVNGAWYGYAAQIVIVPARKFAFIALDNHGGLYPKSERYALEKIAGLTDLTAWVPTGNPGGNAEFVGEYDDAFDSGKLVVSQGPSGLVLTFEGSKQCDLVAQEPDAFTCSDGDIYHAYFARDAMHAVTYLRTNLGIAKRLP